MLGLLARVSLTILLVVALPAAIPAKSWASATLTVSAAASLEDAFSDLATAFERLQPGAKVALNFAGSNLLERQIENGAPVDVFASADEATMSRLARANLVVTATVRVMAENELVLVVPKASKRRARFRELASDRRVSRVAVALQGVPVRTYADQVFSHWGIRSKLKPKLVEAANVRQVLAYVARGEVDAGVVYLTDALAEPDRVGIADRALPAWHSPIRLPIGMIRGCAQPQLAQAFIDFVTRPEGKGILRRRGFKSPDPQAP